MTDSDLIERARALLTESEDHVAVSREKLFALVPVAVSALCELILADASKLDGFRQEIQVQIARGEADLNSLVKTKGLRLDLIGSSDIFVRDADCPLQRTVQLCSQFDRLTLGGIQDYLFIKAHLSGHKLVFRDNAACDGSDPVKSLRGVCLIRAVCLPDSIEKVPAYLHAELARILADLGKAEIAQS